MHDFYRPRILMAGSFMHAQRQPWCPDFPPGQIWQFDTHRGHVRTETENNDQLSAYLQHINDGEDMQTSSEIDWNICRALPTGAPKCGFRI